MFLSVLIFILSVFCTFLVARFFLPLLKRLKFGQPIHELALESQKAKRRTRSRR